MDEIELLDVVALLEPLPEHGLVRGNRGTVVEVYRYGYFEVEFSDTNGQMFAMLPLHKNQLLKMVEVPLVEYDEAFEAR